MPAELFKATEVVEACSVYLGQGIDVRKLHGMSAMATQPLVVKAGARGAAVLFHYGVAVLFGLQPDEIDDFASRIRAVISEPFARPEKETTEIFVDKKMNEGQVLGRICVHSYKTSSLQIVADVLAKSAVLSFYERNLTAHFDRIEPLAERLSRGRHGGIKGRQLLRHIGDVLLIEAKMIGRIEVTELPELIWEYPEYERLYMRLEDSFSLKERHEAIDRKLGLISKTAQTLLDLIHSERSLRVEWYIVILIVIDIVIALAEKHL